MQQFERYRELRLELADTVRSVLYVARARHDEVVEASARTLLKRLAEDRFTVAVIGQHSRGKTTLMNALLGGDYLPTGILPMTSAITMVRYGSAARAVYFRRGSDFPLHTTLDNVPELLARESVRRAELEVERVELEVPAELLRLGLTFVDTPGVGSVDEEGSAATLSFLPNADAVVFVTAVDSAMNDADRRLLALVPPRAPVFCVVNKVDLATDDDAASVLRFTAETLRVALNRTDIEVFGMSALRGLRMRSAVSAPDGHRDQGDAESGSDDGGVGAFEARLETVLAADRARLALGTALDVARDVCAEQARMLELATRFARLSESERQALRAGAREASAHAAVARRAVIGRMLADAQRVVDAETAANRERWIAELVACQPQEWWSARTALLSEAARSAVLRHGADLGTTLDAARAFALATTGVSDGNAASVWNAGELSGYAPPRFGSDDDDSADSDGSSSPHRARGRRRAARETEAMLDAFDDHLREQNRSRGEWIAREAARRADANDERLEHYLAAAPAQPELEALSRARAHLDALAERIDASRLSDHSPVVPRAPRVMHPEDDDRARREPPPAGGGWRTAAGCLVCARQKTALIEDLRHRQLLIATREHDQVEFARIGGLCPQHTWTYAGVASPVGIASAYAGLSAQAAQVLSARSLGADSLAESLVEVSLAYGGDGACPVCRTLARAEEQALRELDDGEGTYAGICLRHLGAAAAAGIRRSVLLALSRRLAEALQRRSDDMRVFALKREAIAGGTLTDEENAAYKEALLLIAGDPLLARADSSDNELDRSAGTAAVRGVADAREGSAGA